MEQQELVTKVYYVAWAKRGAIQHLTDGPFIDRETAEIVIVDRGYSVSSYVIVEQYVVVSYDD